MRSFLRVALVAAAVVCVVSNVPVLALAPQTAPSTWVVIPISQLPPKVRATQTKAYPRSKVTKVERFGAGKTAVYHLTMTGKKTDVKINAAGKIVK